MKTIILQLFIFLPLTSFAQGKWTLYKVDNASSPKNDITSICFDKNENMWISTWYGIYKYTENHWISQGPENIYVQTLFIDHNDFKWAGLWEGGVLRSKDGANWDKIPEATKSQSVNVIRTGQDGSVWVGDWNEGLFVQTQQTDGKEKWTSYRSENVKIGDNAVLSLEPAVEQGMWIGTYHGLSLFENNTWTLFNTQNSKLPDNNVYAISVDDKGDTWVGTGNGLVKISGSTWTVFNNKNSELSCDLVLSLATGLQGDIWVGTNKGVFRFDGDKWTNFTTENSILPDNRIQTIFVHHKKVYFGTSKGLAAYDQ